MKTEEIVLNNFTLGFDIQKLHEIDDILFIDIETTGFLSSTSSIYMIGTSYFKEGNWHIRQFFAETLEEEALLLDTFFDFAKDYNYIIHYNGNTFDLPFIKAKSEKYDIEDILSSKEGLDIYRRITPYKNLLKLPDCKLKTVELFLGIDRDDRYTGGELITVYQDYLNSHDYSLYQKLLLHNSDDMKGMLEILPILSYYDLFNFELKATKVAANYYQDHNGMPKKEIIITVNTPSKLPCPIAFMGQSCYFRAENNVGTLVVPIYEEELKYFYANYKDYYYLPLEDMAIHKSLASFVDKDYREQAKASTCYTRKTGLFLPQWSTMIEPFFKRDYDSTDLFFELTDDIKKDRDLFSSYVTHVLNKLAFQK